MTEGTIDKSTITDISGLPRAVVPEFKVNKVSAKRRRADLFFCSRICFICFLLISLISSTYDIFGTTQPGCVSTNLL
jgi:hypothetical protein